ncbi:MAG: hypothetical protein GXP33_01905 [Spirochaetes bacterium]|nr:hypothetical protein [Spirochaetota bacterium]
MKNKKNRKVFYISLLLIVVVLTLSGCPGTAFKGAILDGPRDIIIDVDNRVFNSQDAVNEWERGLGLDKITFTVTLKSGSETKEMLPADIDSTYNFTQVSIPVEGELISINAEGDHGSDKYTGTIDDKSPYDDYTGWEIFANVIKFKLGFQISDDIKNSYLTMDICPRGGNSVTLKADSGVTATADMKTDWAGTALTSRQIAIEPVFNENPKDLTFDVYTLIVDKDLRSIYFGPLNPGENGGYYEHYPWEENWTYEEITETGKQIGDKIYKLAEYNKNPLTAVEPMGTGTGYNSYLIDLTTETTDPVGKFLLIAVVLNYDKLSIPAKMNIIEIK